MKTYLMTLGDVYQYKIDFAALENERTGALDNWLDRSSSPAEQLASATFSTDSPTGISITGDSLTDNNTSVSFSVSADVVGAWVLTCTGKTNTSPQQTKIVKLKFKVSNA